jgi:hypothetical protein
LRTAVVLDTFGHGIRDHSEMQTVLPTYPAILRAGSLDWGDDPPDLPPGAVPVHVTILASPAPSAGGPAMAAALAALAAAGGPSGFDDPVEWQRETRAERGLPGRDG